MRFRLFLAILVTALTGAMPASAQMFDVFVRGAWSAPEGSTLVRNGEAKVELASGNGGEAGVRVFLGDRFSTELAVASVHHDLDASAFGEHVDLGGTRVTPVSLVLQYHSSPRGAVDFHLGAGAALVIIGNIANTSELQLLGVQAIRFHDSFAPAADAGLDLRLTSRWALTFGAKYLDIHSRTTATYSDGTRETAGLDLKQLSLGVGLACRF